MKRILTIVILLATTLVAMAQDQTELNQLRNDIEQELTGNILPFWLHNAVAPDGGFYGELSREGKGDPDAPRGAVLGARILWTFSTAYRLYAIPTHKELADRIQAYFVAHFIDQRHGGVYWTVTPDGHPLDDVKQTYAQAFAIYGLAEHFRATGNTASLDAAIALFRTLEAKVHDTAKGGYREVLARDFTKTDAKGADGHAEPTKTMNTHIHLMEAYTTLYRVWPDATLRARLTELTDILSTRLYNPATGHLILFCDDDWHALEQVDSYGHDIETAWLLTETAEVLGDEALIGRMRRQAVKMVDAALAEGLNAEGAMMLEKNGRGMDRRLQWWPQCETVVGCINAWQITGQRKYFDQAVKTWNYIKDHFTDRQHGEWFRKLSAEGRPDMQEPKGSLWNCPYHNSRMGYELRQRLAPRTVHSEVMAWSNMTGVRKNGELIDFESSLRVGVPGGRMEATGRERQSNVRYHRDGQSQVVDIPLHGAHFRQVVTDVDDRSVHIALTAEADATLAEGAFFCLTFTPQYYANARIKISGNKVTVSAPERRLTLTFNRKIPISLRQEQAGKVVYATLMPTLTKGRQARLEATLTVDGTPHHETAHIAIDTSNPGARFAGLGGNFRIQNPQKDPMVIDYCLDQLRVAFGRVEFPWAAWDKGGKADPHVRESARMAARLKAIGMPVVVSCWFPPQWALVPGQKRGSGGVAALRLDPAKTSRIYDAMAGYLKFLKDDYGVEADYFSFNESDIGIDVLHTPEEHRDFIKAFGARLAEMHLGTRMLLGDNSDATTIDFIQPALADKDAHKYIGAVSFHSWRGCDDKTLARWRDAARSINVPLIVGEGSTDAAAHRYPAIFRESTFALYEINLYTRLCAICQPLSILQWQLTADYSLLQGQGILGDNGPLRPTQRFFNLKQLSMTPEDAFAVPLTTDKDNINATAFSNKARGEGAVHIVNNGAACKAEITGLPEQATRAIVYVTNAGQNAEAQCVSLAGGHAEIVMPAESFVTLITQ